MLDPINSGSDSPLIPPAWESTASFRNLLKKYQTINLKNVGMS